MATSPVTARQKIYSDLDIAFRANPNTGDVVRKYDINSVRQSVTNIIRTQPGERPFKPTFGCNLRRYLFENLTPDVILAMKTTVKFSLENFEPRITLLNVEVNDDIDKNSISITVEYFINSPEGNTDTLTLALERFR